MKRLLLMIAAYVVLSAQTSLAGSITASYSHSVQNVDFEKYSSERLGGGVGFSLFKYVRLEATYSQEMRVNKGYKESLDSQGYASYQYFESRTTIDSVGGNVSVILYPGQTFMPYVFAGASRSVYRYRMISEDLSGNRAEFTNKTDPIVSPLAGVGLQLMMNREFSIKSSYTWRQGISQLPGEDAKRVYDGSVDVGLTYELN